ncbi:MAG: transketolase C-terminal domain-containing protein [Candidatus Shapirobacteria bacterium]
MTISIRQAFGETLYNLAKTNRNIYVVDMDLKSSLCLNKFAQKYPRRFIECGVAENNAAAIAAGLAKTGKTVFLTSFACFSPAINWNTIKQSIAYNQANVKIIGSHAGLLSTDLGATHQMLEDVALMSAMPNMEVFSPIDSIETEKLITTISHSKTPAYVRLVRATTPQVFDKKLTFTIGKSHILKKGEDITIVGHGPILNQAFDSSLPKKVSLEIINCSSIKPLDVATIVKSVKKTKHLICLEDHQKNGGLGQMIASILLEKNIHPKFVHLAVDNRFGQSGRDSKKLYDYYKIGVNNLIDAINKIL